jgi:hypothetical protein
MIILEKEYEENLLSDEEAERINGIEQLQKLRIRSAELQEKFEKYLQKTANKLGQNRRIRRNNQ